MWLICLSAFSDFWKLSALSQVKSGTIFDNILVTDDIAEAEKEAKDLFEVTKEGEKKMKDKVSSL